LNIRYTGRSRRHPYDLQFSFDEQDTFEIYVAALIVFASLALLQYRAIMLAADAERTPFRHRALFCELILAG
jgi:hypothetical protein